MGNVVFGLLLRRTTNTQRLFLSFVLSVMSLLIWKACMCVCVCVRETTAVPSGRAEPPLAASCGSCVHVNVTFISGVQSWRSRVSCARHFSSRLTRRSFSTPRHTLILSLPLCLREPFELECGGQGCTHSRDRAFQSGRFLLSHFLDLLGVLWTWL